MREIKFKVWDKKDKLWVAGWSIMQSGQLSETKDKVYMQFTGLKDKNGVEIYEGDIIVGQFGYKEVVKIEEFNFITREDSCAGYGFNLDSCNLDNIKKYVEVIGNIYDNPELLDKD